MRAAPLALCYGTRPQVVKAAILTEALGRRWPLLTVDTGQHYDYELNQLVYEQLGVRAPDVWLGVGSGDHGEQTSAVLARAAELLAARRPWAVVVVGDTNSTLGCALAAAKLRIPVVHVEAGLRADDPMMAEEINRRMVDHISAVACAPSEGAAARLRDERVPGTVVCTGDVARDVLVRHATRAPAAGDVGGPAADGPYAFATLHRAELVDDPARLRAAVDALAALPLPVTFAAHPRTRARLAALGLEGGVGAVRVVPPLGYLEALARVRDASVVVTDSGGLQREAYWLGTPCVTFRGETEWGETVALGANRLVPADRADLLGAAVAAALAAGRGWDRGAYGDGDAAGRVGEAVEPLR